MVATAPLSPTLVDAPHHNDAVPVTPRPVRWTKEQYHRLANEGFFLEKRVELIEGEIIEMTAMNPPHWVGVKLADEALRRVFTSGFVVTDQLPISLIDESEPEPDVAIIAGSIRDFITGLPTTAILVVEVSDATLHYDQTRKLRLYARAGIEEYWIVNLVARQLEVHRQPDAGQERYKQVQILTSEESVTPQAAPQASIAVTDLLP
jgi:Uma2 family endonuclease